MGKLKVIDFFCGAGGFSEGFRQQGFEIVHGIDSWEAATKTFNHNFGLKCSPKNILDFETSIEEIENLPDVEIIIGSPPCVTFSRSNKSGKADKSLGVRLTEIFLRIVAVKKHKSNSKLKAWFMENVPSSVNYLNEYYTFSDLNLTTWAKINKINPDKKAIILKGNQPLINSADYGSPQIRHRVISGEFIQLGSFIIPPRTHQSPDENKNLPSYITLGQIKKSLPKPNINVSNKIIIDPLYPLIQIKTNQLTDHFYDTGLYQCEWKQSKFLKTNHPYMGKMSFPENENKPSRTITATKIGTSREAIIYKSEFERKGNGEFRTLTIRESASLMGFPITFQFLGSEGIKCRLVGNAVCPSVSRAFAKMVRKTLKLKAIESPIVIMEPSLKGVENLNSYSPKIFGDPPRRNKGSRFRFHPFKDGNITVTLSNYDIDNNGKDSRRWRTSIQYGNGKGFPTFSLKDGFYKKIENTIENMLHGSNFLKIINNGFAGKIAKGEILQEMYEVQKPRELYLEPTKLIEEIADIIKDLKIENEKFEQEKMIVFKDKETVPLKQLYALYAINKIATIANS